MLDKKLEKAFRACGFKEVDEKLACDVLKIIDWQVELQKIDTSSIEPMYNTLGEVDYIYNQDRAVKSGEDIFQNAPESEDNFFIVPKVVVK